MTVKRCPFLPISRWPESERRYWQCASNSAATVLEIPECSTNWGGEAWRSQEEGYGAFLGWLASIGQLEQTQSPGERCSCERLRAYAAFLARSVRPATALNRITSLQYALLVFTGSVHNKKTFNNVQRLFRHQARQIEHRKPTASRIVLLALGLKLMQWATHARIRPRKRAVLFRDGLLIALLAYRPYRRQVIFGLRLGVTLRKIGSEWTIIPSVNSYRKNARSRKWPKQLMAALNTYIDTHRPVLAGRANTDHLWISYRDRALGPRSIYLAVARRTRNEFKKVSYGVHDFRHATATDAASAEEAAEQLDNSVEVARDFYIHGRSYDARREFIAQIGRLEEEQ